MNNTPLTYILCIACVLALLYIVALLSSIIDQKSLGVKDLFEAWHNKDRAEQWRIKRDRIFLWLYLIIPSLLTIALTLIMQLNIGNLKERKDLSFLGLAVACICTAIVLHKLKKRNKI